MWDITYIYAFVHVRFYNEKIIKRWQNALSPTFLLIYLKTIQMKTAKITPLTIQQYVEISEDVYDEVERVDYAGMLAAKCIKHPEFGDIILISSATHVECLMIHF